MSSRTAPAGSSALCGLRVLDFSMLLPGPLTTLMLSEAGADVVKIEPPDGDPMRDYGDAVGARGIAFAQLSRGKRSYTADLKSDGGRERLAPLAREADVIVEGFRPGVMTRLGFGYEQVAAVNPEVIYCSISGFGQAGPRAAEAGHDPNYLGVAGILDTPTLPAPGPSLFLADVGAGAYTAMINILLAIHARAQGLGGRHLDVAMIDGLYPFAYAKFARAATGGRRSAEPARPQPRYGMYAAADGAVVVVAAIEPHFWIRFCEAVDLPPRLRDDAMAPDETVDAIAELLRRRSGAEWSDTFRRADCCVTVAQTIEEALQDTHLRQRGMFDRVVTAGTEEIPALPLPLATALTNSPRARSSPIVAQQLPAGNGWPTRTEAGSPGTPSG